MRIEDLVVELSKDPFNPELNFKCAVEYKKLNQTASAVSFFTAASFLAYGNNLTVVRAANTLSTLNSVANELEITLSELFKGVIL